MTFQVFFDIDAGGKDMGRITLELRADVVPKTAGETALCSTSFEKIRQEKEAWNLNPSQHETELRDEYACIS